MRFSLLFSLGVLAVLTTTYSRADDPCACCASIATWERYARPLSERERAAASRIPSFGGFLEGAASVTRLEVDLVGEGDVPAEDTSGRVSLFKPRWGEPVEFFHTFTGRPLPSPNVDLYKELAIVGTLELDKELAGELGAKEVTATLVLKGKGDHCFKLEDYWYWLLTFSVEVDGARRDYGAAGDLVKL